MDMLIGSIIGSIFTIFVFFLFKKNEYENRSVVKLHSKNLGNLRFRFIARSMSKDLIWIKRIGLISSSNVKSDIVFPSQVLHGGSVNLAVQEMPVDFTGEVRITEVDARIRENGSWQDCIVIIRGVKDNEVDIEFFSAEE